MCIDSVKSAALHCDLVRECRTLTQLAEVVDGLVQGWWRRRGAVAGRSLEPTLDQRDQIWSYTGHEDGPDR